jgi:kinesin family protein C1
VLQVFESSRTLGKQGWRFAMQASMLEIYNEDYKDLLARKKLPDGRSHKVRWPCPLLVQERSNL